MSIHESALGLKMMGILTSVNSLLLCANTFELKCTIYQLPPCHNIHTSESFKHARYEWSSFSLGRPLKVASRMHEFLLRMSRPFSFALTSEVLLGEPLLENAPLTTTTTKNAVFPELNVSTLNAKSNQNGPFSNYFWWQNHLVVWQYCIQYKFSAVFENRAHFSS